MRLIEYEQKVKELIKTDKNNPEIYNLLQEMIYIFLCRKKIGTITEKKDVSYTFAGDVYMSILSGVDITYFLGYFEKKYKEYFKEYYRNTRFNEPYDPSYDEIKLNKLLVSSTEEFNKIIDKVDLSNINKIIDKVFSSCKYNKNSKFYLNLKLSLVLSLIRNDISSFHLNHELDEYLRLLVILFYNELKISLNTK